jgi:tetratricopeptide (TPR) repeat protein
VQLSSIALAISLVGAAQTPDPSVPEDCASCSVEGAVQRARDILEGARLALPRPGQGGVYGVLTASELADTGDLAGALKVARYAAARCAEQSAPVCGELYTLVAELTVINHADDPVALADAAGYLALVEPDRVSRAVCARAFTLRFRLVSRSRPWAGEPRWADGCGGFGRTGELGYLAARSALVRGELDDAERRIRRLRLHAPERAVRVLYLEAVLHVARGELVKAERRFDEILALGPSATRSEGEDDARTLAALQLARLRREAGEPAEALALYQRVPAGSVGRPEALLEGSVVAAHVGDLGAARLYLGALDSYPARGNAIERERVKANLAVIDGDEAVARAVFRELSEQGRLQSDRLGTVEADAIAALRADPSLGGLLDPALARGLFRLESELALLEGELGAAELKLAALEGASGGTALDESLARADAYLRRAERDLRIADRETQEAAAELRVDLDLALSLVAEATAEKRAGRTARRAELEEELRGSRAGLKALRARLRLELEALKGQLLARAREVIDNLVMSEEVGELELVWRRKLESSRELQRIREEYDEGLATLTSDTGVKQEASK